MSALRVFAIAFAVVSLLGCGKSGKDAPKTADQQRVEREALEKAREERAVPNPDQMFDKALKTQERAAKRAEAQRQKILDDAAKRSDESNKNEGKAK